MSGYPLEARSEVSPTVPSAIVTTQRRADSLLTNAFKAQRAVEIAPDKVARFEKWMAGMPLARIGEVKAAPELVIKGAGGKEVVRAPWPDLKKAWQGTFKGW